MSQTENTPRPLEAVATQLDDHPKGGSRGIVVGLDGSKGSLRAFRWALEEAHLRGIPVHCVLAWEQEIPYYGGGTSRFLGPDRSIGGKPDLQAYASAELARLKKELDVPEDVEITYEVLEGHPAEVLVRRSKDAVALAVGSRGHGGFVGALLGSVSQHIVQHANCPVVITRN
jgi:nucleotide-binding universal stress UspA family protein